MSGNAGGAARKFTELPDIAFVDTNILVYAFDASHPQKQEIASKLILDGLKTDSLAFSAQVFAEFMVVMTGKIARPLTETQAAAILRTLRRARIVDVTRDVVFTAIRLRRICPYHFWDRLILASAMAAGAGLVLSEDMRSGHHLPGLIIRNPFP